MGGIHNIQTRLLEWVPWKCQNCKIYFCNWVMITKMCWKQAFISHGTPTSIHQLFINPDESYMYVDNCEWLSLYIPSELQGKVCHSLANLQLQHGYYEVPENVHTHPKEGC